MNAKKKKTKQRRRARKLAEQAWDAATDGHRELAARIIRRATQQDAGNPLLWTDQGRILAMQGDDESAALALHTALSLAPDFAEAYAELAAIRFRQGLLSAAVSLQQQAARLEPDSSRIQESLNSYEAAAGVLHASTPHATHVEEELETGGRASCPIEQQMADAYPELAKAIDDLPWANIKDSLTQRGYAHIKRLFQSTDCEGLRGAFHQDELFADTVVMNKARFGRGEYRYFAPPIPRVVDALRRLAYPPLAKIVNAWRIAMDQDDLFPLAWEGLRVRCAEFEQLTPSPILLRYEQGGFNELHRDIRGQVYFPLQLAVVLSHRRETDDDQTPGFSGGEFLFCDDFGRKKEKPKAIAAGEGDAIVFCTRERLVNIAGVHGLQRVKHGAARIQSGTRYALGVPFHEYT